MNTKTVDIKGLIYAFFGYLIWGLLPLYWKQLKICSPAEILSSRIVWSFLFLSVISLTKYKKIILEYLRNNNTRSGLMITALLVSLNWVVYIYAVNNNEIIQASMGYYINPFINIFFGVFLLKEKISFLQWSAIACAFIGVIYMAVYYGDIPWISLTLAFSFSVYGLLKKIFGFNSVVSLFLEMSFMFPLAFGYQIYLLSQNSNHLFTGIPHIGFFIVFSGAATVIPLLLFTEGAKKISYSTIGILQFFAPTLMFLIGVFVYGEIFSRVYKISFAFIWTGVLVYIYAILKNIALKNRQS